MEDTKNAGQFHIIGSRLPRVETKNMVTGATQYVDDIDLPNMLYCKILRSTIHRGKIIELDYSDAERIPGVVCIVDATSIPHNKVGGRYDTLIFAEGEITHKHQPIAAVAAETEEIAMEAVKAIKVKTEEWPAVLGMEEAMRPDSVVINPNGNTNFHDFLPGMPLRKIRLGDVEEGFAKADYIIESTYDINPIEHVPLETQASVAYLDFMDRLTIYSTSQAIYSHINQLTYLLDIPISRLRLLSLTVGGGFGGKNDVQCDPYTGLLALKTRRPVKYTLTREEEMTATTIRGKWKMHYKDGVTKDGYLTARYCQTYLDSGPTVGLGAYCMEKGSSVASGPYYCPNIWVDARLIFTNKAKGSSLRGLGVFSSMYASESQMSKMAKAIGMDPIEFRLKNAWRDGDTTNTHMKVNAVAAIECLQKVAQMSGIELSDELKAMNSYMGR